MRRSKCRIFLTGIEFLICSILIGCRVATNLQPEENIAIGKKYTLKPLPNYSHCKDPEDLKQLTDGIKYTDENQPGIWVRKGTVGWRNTAFAEVTIDLEKVEPIDGVAFHTAFDGPQNVMMPSVIYVMVSDDGKIFRKVCNLVDEKNGVPVSEYSSKQKQHICEYSNKSLNTRGRYVSFIASSNFIFCDEIEVYRGPDSLLSKAPDGEVIDDMESAVSKAIFNRNVKLILSTDLNNIRNNAAALKLGNAMEAKFARLEKEIKDMALPLPSPDYKAVTPLNNLHSRILSLNAEIMETGGMPLLNVWNNNRWEPLNATALPSSNVKPIISFEMLNNEHRGAVLNLTNADSRESEIKISFAGVPGGAIPEYLSLFQVEFVGAKSAEMVAAPLVPSEKSKDGFIVKIPSGMTRQIWINCNPQKLATGLTRGAMILKMNSSEPVKIPLHIKIYPYIFPDTPHLSLWVWDYTDEKPFCFPSMSDKNLQLAAEDMKAHSVTPGWGPRTAACWPGKKDFDADGNLTAPLKTAVFDEWVKRYGTHMNYALCIGNDLKTFAGESVGTTRSARMISQWLERFIEHAEKRGIDTEKQLILHFIDEPGPKNPSHLETNTKWGRIVKNCTSKIKTFCDPSGFETNSPELKEMLKYIDIVCPHLPEYGNRMDNVLKYMKESSGGIPKELAFYSCIAGRTADPYYYHRLQAWYCVKYNAKKMGYWTYWNYWRKWRNSSEASWNELILLDRDTWGMVYTTENSLVSSKHWEAVREGIEDYEYFVILRDKIRDLKKKESPILAEAEKLLATLPEKVVSGYKMNMMHWKTDKNRNAADEARIEILKMLEKLSNK